MPDIDERPHHRGQLEGQITALWNPAPVKVNDEELALLPTPHANATTGPGTQGRDGGPNLQTAVQTLT